MCYLRESLLYMIMQSHFKVENLFNRNASINYFIVKSYDNNIEAKFSGFDI